MEETLSRLDMAWRQSGKSQMLFVETLRVAVHLKEITPDQAVSIWKSYQWRLGVDAEEDE